MEVDMNVTTYVKNGIVYANASKSKRNGKTVGKEKQISLGRVIDLKKKIFRNRKYGLYSYDPVTEKITPISEEGKKKNVKNFSCVDFGDSFFLSRLMEKLRIDPMIDSMEGIDHESLKALILFYLECRSSNSTAEEWFEGNFASSLYPDAKMSSQRISELLDSIGTEEAKSSFLKAYYSASDFKKGTKVIIDSTGIINNVHFSFTTVCNHGGKVSTCIRLITVIREEDSKPVYFRMAPGSTLDATTLKKIVIELGKYGIDISYALVDAGYSTKENLKRLMTMKIGFITRLDAKLGLYKELKEKYIGTLRRKENLIHYAERYFYVEEVPNATFENEKINAYVCLDRTTQSYEVIRMSEGKDSPDDSTAFEEMEEGGFFILVSKEKIGKEDVLRRYYMRQRIEQSYDLTKNETNIFPLRNHNESTVNGHLLVSFICQIISQEIQNTFKEDHLSQEKILLALRNQKAEVYPAEILPMETKKVATLAYKKMKIDCPETLKIKEKEVCR